MLPLYAKAILVGNQVSPHKGVRNYSSLFKVDLDKWIKNTNVVDDCEKIQSLMIHGYYEISENACVSLATPLACVVYYL